MNAIFVKQVSDAVLKGKLIELTYTYINNECHVIQINISSKVIRCINKNIIGQNTSVIKEAEKFSWMNSILGKIKITRFKNAFRKIINDNISQLKLDIEVLFEKNDYNKNFIVNFGDNFFPEKDYRGIHYDEGEYESLVVTIGEGEGDNWWCVLFPPLCLLEAETNEVDDTEYQFFVAEMLKKIFS